MLALFVNEYCQQGFYRSVGRGRGGSLKAGPYASTDQSLNFHFADSVHDSDAGLLHAKETAVTVKMYHVLFAHL